MRKLASSIVSPIQSLARGVVSPVASFFDNIGSMWSANSTVDRLEKENSELRTQLIAEKDKAGRVKQFDQLLQTAGKAGFKIVAAEVVANASGAGLKETVTIDVGSDDGITPDMTVMSGDGLVGRVVKVQKQTATVLLITDPTFSVGVRLVGSDVLGIATGNGGPQTKLELLDPQAQLNVGDIVVARGSAGGRPFVPGVPVGRVVKVERTPGALTRKAVLEPMAKLGKLDIVGVVLNPPARDPRDSLIPPAPIPTPIPTVTVYATPPATPSSSPTTKSTP